MSTDWLAAYFYQTFAVAVFCSAKVRTTVKVAVHDVHAKEFANVTVNSTAYSRAGVHSTVHDRITLLFALNIRVIFLTNALKRMIAIWEHKSFYN